MEEALVKPTEQADTRDTDETKKEDLPSETDDVDNFLQESAAMLESMTEQVLELDAAKEVRATPPTEPSIDQATVTAELNPLRQEAAEQASKPKGTEDIREIGRRLQREGKLPTPDNGHVIMKEAPPREEQTTKPKLKLPNAKGTNLKGSKIQKEVKATANKMTAQPISPPLETEPKAPKQANQTKVTPVAEVDEETPLVLNSIKHTEPQDRVMQGVGATRIMGNLSLPINTSHPVEFIRQLEMMHDDEQVRDSRMAEIHRSNQASSAPSPHIGRIFSDFIGLTKAATELNTQNLEETSAHQLSTHQRRDLRVMLSMNDLSLPLVLRQTHQEWVKGTPLQEMRTMGIGPDELIAIGISWSDWLQKQQYGVKELAFMGGSWQHAVRMGFMPEDIVLHRDKCGPNILKEYWKVSFEDLEWSLGLTVDEAVGMIKLTTADFAVLGETVSSLIRKGFGSQHAAAMDEPCSSFQMALGATDQDLRLLFGQSLEEEVRATKAAQQNTTALQEVHVRTGKPFRPVLKKAVNREFKF